MAAQPGTQHSHFRYYLRTQGWGFKPGRIFKDGPDTEKDKKLLTRRPESNSRGKFAHVCHQIDMTVIPCRP